MSCVCMPDCFGGGGAWEEREREIMSGRDCDACVLAVCTVMCWAHVNPMADLQVD